MRELIKIGVATSILAITVASFVVAGPASAATNACGASNTVVGVHKAKSATSSETNGGCGKVGVQNGYRPVQNGGIYYLNWKWGSLMVQQSNSSGYITEQGKHTVQYPGIWPGFPFYS